MLECHYEKYRELKRKNPLIFALKKPGFYMQALGYVNMNHSLLHFPEPPLDYLYSLFPHIRFTTHFSHTLDQPYK